MRRPPVSTPRAALWVLCAVSASCSASGNGAIASTRAAPTLAASQPKGTSAPKTSVAARKATQPKVTAAPGRKVMRPPTANGRGAAARAVGPDSRAKVPKGVQIPVGASIQSYIDRYPEGTTFVLAPGVHRGQFRLAPRARQTFFGAPGAVLSGAQVVTTWTLDERGTWSADARFMLTGTGVGGECLKGRPLCNKPELVFMDNRPLTRVATAAEVVPGSVTWFLDEASGRLTIGPDPSGRTIEGSPTGVAMIADLGRPHDSVTIRNLVVEKYATPAQECALQLADTGGGFHNVTDPNNGRGGWTLIDLDVRWNKACGVFAGAGTRVESSLLNDNGQQGMKGTGRGVRIIGNEIARNNWAGFEILWEAGGVKLWNAADVVMSDNWVHDNFGNGLWADYALQGVVYERNSLTENAYAGIVHEMTLGGQIRRNYLRGNDYGDRGDPGYMKGAIFVFGAPDTEITQNVLDRNVGGIIALMQERGCIAPLIDQGTGACPPGALRGSIANLWVHDNDIILNEGFSGVQALATANYPPYAEQTADWARRVFQGSNIRFEDNRYRGSGFGSNTGSGGQYDDANLRFVWGFPQGGLSDPSNVYSWVERRYLGFDDWRAIASQDKTSTLR